MGLFDFLKKKADAKLEEERLKKERLLQWQKAVMIDSPDQLIMTEQQLKAITVQQAENDLRIIQDSIKLIETTLKPDVFFMRLKLLYEKLAHLCNIEQYIEFTGAVPSAAYHEFSNDYDEAIKQFLIRYFSDTFDKAESMKTEKGRIGKYQKFYDSLQEYYYYMNDESIEYIETKYNAYTRK